MSLSLRSVETASPDIWDELWQATDSATFFQSRTWAEAWCAADHGARPAPQLLSFSDGARILLPLTEKTSRWSRSLLLSPAGTYGGWLSVDPPSVAHVDLVVAHLLSQRASITWRLNPFDPSSAAVRAAPLQADTTRVIDLRPGLERTRRAWTKGHRSAASKARREGVRVELAETIDDWRGYFVAYEDSLRRWGARATSRYGWVLFAALRVADPAKVRLWIARHGGRVVAGALVFHSRRHAVYWHGAALEDAFPLRPVHLLVSEAIERACSDGAHWFDFNPSGRHEGVESFKKGFGAVSLECPVLRTEGLLARWRRRAGALRAALLRRGPSDEDVSPALLETGTAP